MLGYRYWKLAWQPDAAERERPVLISAGMDDPWWSSIKAADHTPAAENRHGLYAWLAPVTFEERVGAFRPVYVFGAVDVYGTVVVHEDGAVRGEYARILALRIVDVSTPCNRVYTAHYGVGGLQWVLHCDCHVFSDDHRLAGKRWFNLEQLEELLLQRYEVPRLPDGVWRSS